jgi:hypothetical protein
VRIEETAVSGFKTCGRNRRAHGGCPGYDSEPIDLIVEKITVTFGDSGSPTSDPYHALTSHERVRLRPVHEEDWKCSHCGEVANLSLEARVEFPRLSETGPEEIVRRAEAERARDQRSADALDAGERQAIALERLAASTTGTNEVRELREELQQLRALMANGNGHAEAESDQNVQLGQTGHLPSEPAAARPRKRTP